MAEEIQTLEEIVEGNMVPKYERSKHPVVEPLKLLIQEVVPDH